MPVVYKIEPELGLILYVMLGSVHFREILHAEQLASQDPLRQPNMKIVLDATNAEVDLDVSDLKDALEMNRRRSQVGAPLEPTALVTYSRFAQSLADIFSMLGDNLPLKLKVFSTLQDALNWLALQEHLPRVDALRAALLEELRARADAA
jgi:hypothetical protein